MKKVYQTIVDKGNGNCVQAVIASLFEKELHEVPEFKPTTDSTQQRAVIQYFFDMGYYPTTVSNNKVKPTFDEILKFDGGIDGYFYASVASRTYENCSHAVVIDINGNVVHDPNPNGLCLGLGINDIQDFYSVNDFYINLDRTFRKGENYKEIK